MAGRLKHQKRSHKTCNKDAAGKNQFFYQTQVKTQKLVLSVFLQNVLMKMAR